jgi:hypothetical protein
VEFVYQLNALKRTPSLDAIALWSRAMCGSSADHIEGSIALWERDREGMAELAMDQALAIRL